VNASGELRSIAAVQLPRPAGLSRHAKTKFSNHNQRFPDERLLVSLTATGINIIMSSTLQPLQPLIVAVDDEADDIFFLRHILQKTALAHRFQPFGNGDASIIGLTSLTEAGSTLELPLVCFLDIKMAGMTGFDVLKWIRGQKALDGMPVVMFSSSDDPRDVDGARELGAQGYLKKYPSAAAMQTVLDEAREFALLAPPKKTFLQWSYRFVESSDAVAAK
jgi:CheY-like chemotaxis protein